MIDPPNESPEDENVFYSTGMTVLDQRLGSDLHDETNGIPGGSLILIHAPPETNLGTLFAQRVLINLLDQFPASKAYYMHSSRPQHVVRKEFKAYSWDISTYEKGDRWEFIDMWHITSSHVASSSRIGKIDIRRKSYLKQAFERMQQVHETENTTCFSVVDNLLWLKEDEFDKDSSKILEYFKDLTDQVVRIGGLHFLVLPKGIVEDTTEKIIMSIVNGIFDFSRIVLGTKNQDQLAIIKMMGVTYNADILDITPDSRVGLRIESTGKI